MDKLTALNEPLAKICKFPPMICPCGIHNPLSTSPNGEDNSVPVGPSIVSLGQCNFRGIIVSCNAGIYELDRRMAERHSREQAGHRRCGQRNVNDPEGWRWKISSKD